MLEEPLHHLGEDHQNMEKRQGDLTEHHPG